jgi:hypothetical protein
MNDVNNAPKDTGEETPAEEGAASEQKTESQVEPGTTQKTDDSKEGEGVKKIKIGDAEYDPKDVETALKKAQDFDRSVELKRLAKLEKKQGDKPEGDEGKPESTPAFDAEAIQEIIAKTLDEKLKGINTQSANQNLGTAYREFIADNKWADSDEIIENISKNFDSSGAVAKEDLLARLDDAARRTYPTKYKEAMEARIREKVLAEQNAIDTADGGSSGVRQTGDTDGTPKPPSAEQIALARKAGNDPRDVYPEYYKTVDPDYFTKK